MARLNRPALMVYGGTIRAGHALGKPRDIISAFQSYGEYLAGVITDEQRVEIVRHACPGAGACGGMYTANTMAVAIEALGLSLPVQLVAARRGSRARRTSAAAPARRRALLLERDLKPRDILTRKAFENALAMVMAVGGSTNAVLHLLAIARAAGVPLSLDDFQTASDRVPLLADLKPSGKYVQEDLHAVGGTPAVMKYLLERGFLHGDCMTVTGRTLAENLADAAAARAGPAESFSRSSTRCCRAATSASSGATWRRTAPWRRSRARKGSGSPDPPRSTTPRRRCWPGSSVARSPRGSVVVIRYEGPKGGPGMPEMLTPTSAIMGAGLGKDVAMLTDGRFSGGSHGFIIGHITPEAQDGGPIALVRDGDRITVDAGACELNVDLSLAEMATRKAAWKAPHPKVTGGVLGKYRTPRALRVGGLYH